LKVKKQKGEIILKVKKRKDVETNRLLVEDAFVTIYEEKNRRPSHKELAIKTHLSEKTIMRHLQMMDQPEWIKDLRVFTPKILLSLYERAKEGRAPEVKLWFQLVEGFRESHDVKHEGNILVEKIEYVYEGD